MTEFSTLLTLWYAMFLPCAPVFQNTKGKFGGKNLLSKGTQRGPFKMC
jgi:hypothetical protein